MGCHTRKTARLGNEWKEREAEDVEGGRHAPETQGLPIVHLVNDAGDTPPKTGFECMACN